MALLNDPNKKRDETLGQRYGVGLRLVADTAQTVRDNALYRPLHGLDQAVGASQQAAGSFVRDASASYAAGKPVAAPPPAPVATPVRNPYASTTTGGVVAPVRPNAFAGVHGTMRALAPPVPRPGDANTFTGANGVTRPINVSVSSASAARQPFTAPGISGVQAPLVTNQSEATDQRRAREGFNSLTDSVLFALHGKTTPSAHRLIGDLLRTKADLVNTAGNQAVALKSANQDAQTRLNAVGLQNQGENDRAVVAVRGENERASLLDAGETSRERIKLQRPSLLTDREGGYLLVDPTQGVARPVLSNGQQVRGLVEGAITPVDRLASLQEELSAQQQSLTPNAARMDSLERQVDAIRSGNGPAGGAYAGYTLIGMTKDGRKVYRDASGKTYSEERAGGAP